MRCPMRRWEFMDKRGQILAELAICEEKECAWWVKGRERCCITRIDEWLGEIGYELNCIKNVMYKQAGEEIEREVIGDEDRDTDVTAPGAKSKL